MKSEKTPVRSRAAIFTRHRVERALFWHITSDPKRKPTRDFLIRVKHLLELDRSAEPDPGYAFSAEPPGGKGFHGLLSAYDALLLYVGVQLLDTGLKRKEIVALLRNVREPLGRRLHPLMDRRAAAVADGEKFVRDYDPREPENRSFLLMPRVEDLADYVDPSDRGLIAGRVAFRMGLEELKAQLDNLPLEHLVVLEIGGAMYWLPIRLAATQEAPRGRPKN